MPVSCICRVCQRPFLAYPSRIQKGQGIYCSKSCKAKDQHVPLYATCLFCTARFRVKASHVQRGYGKYCSSRCMGLAKRTRIDTTCRYCGISFSALPGRLAQGLDKYCSPLCYQQYMAQHIRLPLQERFWLSVLKTEDCWIWQGKITHKGYGRFAIGSTRQVFAHRFAYELTYGLILPGLLCCHHCDNPPCVRPDHLFLGTQSDNLRDMVRKQRHSAVTHPESIVRGDQHPRRLHPERFARGEQAGNAKLTAMQVRELRCMYAKKQGSYATLAQAFSVSVTLVRKIIIREVWKHLS